MTRVGIIDVGTNSVRLLIADVEPHGVASIRRDLTITRLGAGVDESRMLGDAPLARTVDAITGYMGEAVEADVELVRIIATSAVRDARNRETFTDAVRAATGHAVDVIGGDEEARLGFGGATMGLDGPVLVVDIGGGSTEIVRGAGAVERFVSLDIGSVRLTERHVRSDPPAPTEVEAVRSDARTALDGAAAVLDAPGATLVGLAGTITTLAAIDLELHGYDREAIHHARLSRAAVARITSDLIDMTSEQRRELPAMPRGREDVIVAGALIAEEVMDGARCPELLVSESDILDGAAADAAARHHK